MTNRTIYMERSGIMIWDKMTNRAISMRIWDHVMRYESVKKV